MSSPLGRAISPPTRLGQSLQQQNRKPEAIWPLVLVALIVTQVVCVAIASQVANGLAALIGLIGSVVILGVSRAREAQHRAGGRFSDWRIEASRIMNVLTMVSWTIGVMNVFFVAKEFTR